MAQTDYISITIPLPPVAYSANSRSHWSQRRGGRASANAQVYAHVLDAVRREGHVTKEPPRHARVHVLFVLPDMRRRDHDSLIARMKPVFDALVHLNVLSDDSLDAIGWPEYRHTYGRPGRVCITVYAMRG